MNGYLCQFFYSPKSILYWMKDRFRILLAILIVCIMVTQLTVFTLFADHETEPEPIPEVQTLTSTTSNSEIANLWVRPDGSEIGVWNYTPPYVANQTPLLGMNYFGTNVLLVTWDYLLPWINCTTSYFPADCEMYIQTQYGVDGYNAVADVARYDSRIIGVFVDDFEVSLQSPSNMSDYYLALHHEDTNFTVPRDLQFAVIVYNYNYFDQTPYSWEDIGSFVDIINFWYVGWTYPLTWNVFAGYRDDFMEMRNLIPDKEYWIGIYLHWYNAGQYPLKLTYELMSVGGKLIKEGLASQYSILENYWIQVHPETANIVRNFINNEYQANFTTTWQYHSDEHSTYDTVYSYSNGIELANPLIENISNYHTFVSRTSSHTFDSLALQNLTITGEGLTPNFMLFNQRTGEHERGYFDHVNGTLNFIVEPLETYRIMSFGLITYWVNGTFEINTDTVWDSREYYISGLMYVNASLSMSYCILHFGNFAHDRNMFNNTYPKFGMIIAADDIDVHIYDSVLEPRLRCYPWLFNRTQAWAGYDQELYFARSIFACYSDRFAPAGKVSFKYCTFYQVQPTGKETYMFGLRLNCAGYIMRLTFIDCLIWNGDSFGTVGVMIMPYNLQRQGLTYWFVQNLTIVGGNWGFWIDLTLSEDTTFYDVNIYSNCTDDSEYVDKWFGMSYKSPFISFRLDGTSVSQKVIVETTKIFTWSVKGSNSTVPQLELAWTIIENGVWYLTHNNNTISLGITTSTFYLLMQSPWNTYQDNYSLTRFSSTLDTQSSMGNIIWLLVFFLLPIMMTQYMPRIGFMVGMAIMLMVFGFMDISFIPYMVLGMLAVGIMIYKGD